MLFLRASLLIVGVFLVLASSGCVEDKDFGESNNLRPDVNRNVDVNANGNVADDNEERLDSLINLPFEPIENSFREDPPPAANTENAKARRLTIVLRFTPENAAKLVETASKQQPPFKTDVEAEPWFPAELIAKSGTSGNEQLRGIGYSAADFVKAPWLKGSLIRIEDTDYFVLILQNL